MVYDGRVAMPQIDILKRELMQLRIINDKKVDHPRNGCFIGDTRIPLLDGTYPQMSELVGRQVWVYSSTPDGKIVPGLARGRMTKHTDELVDVILDNGYVARCTPEHLWMLRDGSYKEAQHLVPGVDRLMPITINWPVNGRYINDLVKMCDNNHKVRAVIPVKLDEPVPVYDLEVDDYHNFALSGGVFVHNSKDLSDAVAGAVYNAVANTKRNTKTKIVIHNEYSSRRAVAEVEEDTIDVPPEIARWIKSMGVL